MAVRARDAAVLLSAAILLAPSAGFAAGRGANRWSRTAVRRATIAAIATSPAPTARRLSRTELAALGASAEAVFAEDKRPVILFDGVCALCNGGVDFMLRWDRPNELDGAYRFAALQSDVGRALLARSGRQPDDLSSIVLVMPNGEARTKSEAILSIGSRCGGGTPLEALFPLASFLGSALPRPLRDGLYEQVASNRYKWFGHSDECRLSDERFSARFIERVDGASAWAAP
ncbi:hypothetical protein KFE25_000328 [Diacronema lutheri]|uniref:DUF393 domain-containing protein n=1 Tax=Diacronema lutheri TaxID=2081491 RepID=A0A8J5XRD5_DIALT|nr:hypothetical protein KFE25_000328 [Diacronema lutheri]